MDTVCPALYVSNGFWMCSYYYFGCVLVKISFYWTETPFYDRPPVLVHLFDIENTVQEVKASIQLKS